MLDFSKLYPQIAKLGEYRALRRREVESKLGLAKERLSSADAKKLSERASIAKTSWLIALPKSEHPSSTYRAPATPKSYAVLAADGSQVEPSRDAIGSLHLLNIGTVAIAYGPSPSADLESDPKLYFEENDVIVTFGGEQREVAGQVLKAKRDLLELAALRKRISRVPLLPAIALVDGTLILWHVEPKPENYRRLPAHDLKKRVFEAMFSLLSSAREARVPVAGYISAPGSTDVINLVRIDLCPLEAIDCDSCPFSPEERRCRAVDGLADSMLFRSMLNPGERSAIFASSSSILTTYPMGHTISFFYLNVGPEVARVEIPEWIAAERKLLETTHALVLDQASKGSGYPISLAEAHEQAVVKEADREAFSRLVWQFQAKKGLKFQDSQKTRLKRRIFV